MNKKGLFIIKVLTGLLLLGSICFVFIPKLINYIDTNKKKEYIKVVQAYINDVKSSIASSKYKQLPSNNEALLVQLSHTNINKKSPYGSLKNEYSYVIVLNDNSNFEYYFACIDTSNRGIPLVKENELNIDSIEYGIDNLQDIVKVSNIGNIYIKNTLFEKKSDTSLDDYNILLKAISGDLSVSYDFRKEVVDMYSALVKNIDPTLYTKEVNINNGTLKYNNESILSGYSKNLNGMYRYLSFPHDNNEKYFASFVVYNNTSVAGLINPSDRFLTDGIVFSSTPAVVIYPNSTIVKENGINYIMWNLMSIYPKNDNYSVTECGAIVSQNNNVSSVNLTFDTANILIGKSNNNCELGNIFAIRKTDYQKNDKFFVRGYIKYVDKYGKNYTAYSSEIVSYLAS